MIGIMPISVRFCTCLLYTSCTRAGMLESFLIAPEDFTNDQVMELLKIAFRQPEVALALAKMIHDLHKSRSVPNLSLIHI